MDSFDWRVLRAYVPTVMALAVALASTYYIRGWVESPFLVALVPVARWVPVAAFVVAVLHGTFVTYRFWQAEQGRGLQCHHCGGPLGGERTGRYGPYRSCLACMRNVSARHYE